MRKRAFRMAVRSGSNEKYLKCMIAQKLKEVNIYESWTRGKGRCQYYWA